MKTDAKLIVLAALLVACATPRQKRERAEAEAAISAASVAVSNARIAGGEVRAASQMRSADSDLRSAQEQAKQGRWTEARQRAKLAESTAEKVTVELESERKRAAAEAAAPKPAKARSPKGRSVR